MNELPIHDLLEKYKNNQCNNEELAQLEVWYLQWQPDHSQINGLEIMDAQKEVWAKVSAEIKPVRKIINYRTVGIAAAIGTVLLSAAIWLNNMNTHSAHLPVYANDVSPGGNGATLTLADGSKIKLNNAKVGALNVNANMKIVKAADGRLVYEITKEANAPHQINTLSTGKGETYQLVLSDGSSVWLNAGSSISFATELTENGQRKVRLNGEAYFEVAKDKTHPFIVETENQQVEVLGTHFNINAYQEETEIKTTLLEGSVDVQAFGSHKILSPGTEAINTGKTLQVHAADPKLAIAWKNNKFVFNNENIQSIMREVARWYNVEVQYRGQIPSDAFEGSVSRFDKISTVLSILESTGQVHFEIHGRTIYVSKSTDL